MDRKIIAMSDRSNHPSDTTNSEYLQGIRNAAAGIVRDLMSAVLQTDRRDLISEAVRNSWFTGTNLPSTRRVPLLLNNAATNLGNFEAKFGGSSDSIPSPDDDGSSSIDDVLLELQGIVISLSDPEELRRAAHSHRDSEPVNWESLVNWGDVPRIRELLDQLPVITPGRHQREAGGISELFTEPPCTIRYGEISVPKVRSGIWKFVDFLCRHPNLTASFDSLSGTDAVWDDPADSKQNEDEWPRVRSRVRDTNAFFEKSKIPIKAHANKGTRFVYLTSIDLSSPDTGGSTNKRASKKAPTKPKSPAKKSLRVKEPPRNENHRSTES